MHRLTHRHSPTMVVARVEIFILCATQAALQIILTSSGVSSFKDEYCAAVVVANGTT